MSFICVINKKPEIYLYCTKYKLRKAKRRISCFYFFWAIKDIIENHILNCIVCESLTWNVGAAGDFRPYGWHKKSVHWETQHFSRILPWIQHRPYLEYNTDISISQCTLMLWQWKMWINEWWMNDEYITYIMCIMVIGVHRSWKITGMITTVVLKYKNEM